MSAYASREAVVGHNVGRGEEARAKGANLYNWLLSLHCNEELLLLDLDIEVPSLKVARNFGCDVQVTDCLSPFVWKSSLLCCFFCTSCSFLLGGRVCAGRRNGI
jgi:hypothetical protein